MFTKWEKIFLGFGVLGILPYLFFVTRLFIVVEGSSLFDLDSATFNACTHLFYNLQHYQPCKEIAMTWVSVSTCVGVFFLVIGLFPPLQRKLQVGVYVRKIWGRWPLVATFVTIALLISSLSWVILTTLHEIGKIAEPPFTYVSELIFSNNSPRCDDTYYASIASELNTLRYCETPDDCKLLPSPSTCGTKYSRFVNKYKVDEFNTLINSCRQIGPVPQCADWGMVPGGVRDTVPMVCENHLCQDAALFIK